MTFLGPRVLQGDCSTSKCGDRNQRSWDEGLTRQETNALGTNKVYWVWFDEPQYDADGNGPYRGGQIWESALTIVTENAH